MAGKILVIGATGTVGRALLPLLSGKGEEVQAATRRLDLQSLPANTEPVMFDLERPETFGPALIGVDRVFLIARPGDDHADKAGLPLLEQMKRAGIRQVVDLSALGAETREDFALRKIEMFLESSGMGFTHLRPNWFMQIFSSGPLLKDILSTSAIHVPGADAKISYVDVRDIAAVAAAALTDPKHAGKAYTLTGTESLDFSEVAEKISSASGREVRYAPITENAARWALASAGFSENRVERLIQFYQLVRNGFCAPVSNDIPAVLGREPIRFAQFTHDNSACWIEPVRTEKMN